MQNKYWKTVVERPKLQFALGYDFRSHEHENFYNNEEIISNVLLSLWDLFSSPGLFMEDVF